MGFKKKFKKVNIDNPLIIEFNGLPGCGKTSVSQQVYYELSLKGMNVLDFNQYLFNHKHDMKTFLTAILFLRGKDLLFIIHFFNFVCSLKSLKLSNVKRFIVQMRNYTLLVKCYRSNNNEYILLDQGIMQDMLSFAYNKQISNGKAVKKVFSNLNLNLPNYFFINAELEITTVEKRILNRKDGSSRLDYVDTGSLKCLLSVQKNNLIFLRNNNLEIQNMTINMKKSIGENAIKVCQRIS